MLCENLCRKIKPANIQINHTSAHLYFALPIEPENDSIPDEKYPEMVTIYWGFSFAIQSLIKARLETEQKLI